MRLHQFWKSHYCLEYRYYHRLDPLPSVPKSTATGCPLCLTHWLAVFIVYSYWPAVPYVLLQLAGCPHSLLLLTGCLHSLLLLAGCPHSLLLLAGCPACPHSLYCYWLVIPIAYCYWLAVPIAYTAIGWLLPLLLSTCSAGYLYNSCCWQAVFICLLLFAF